jgi:hypothetical protein
MISKISQVHLRSNHAFTGPCVRGYVRATSRYLFNVSYSRQYCSTQQYNYHRCRLTWWILCTHLKRARQLASSHPAVLSVGVTLSGFLSLPLHVPVLAGHETDTDPPRSGT